MVDRKGSDSVGISNPTLTFILAIQPDLLQDIMGNQTMGGRGLLARFLYSIPTSTIGTRKYSGEPIPQDVESRFRFLIHTLPDIPSAEMPYTYTFSDASTKMLEHYFYLIEAGLGKEQTLKNWLSKHVGSVMRIAGNLHLASQLEEPEIPSTTTEAAIEIGKYFGAHARHSFVTLSGEAEMKKAKDVLSILYKMGTGAVTRRDLFRKGGNRGLKKVEELAPILGLLEDYGYIMQSHGMLSETSSKSSELIFLNPHYTL